MNLKEYVNICTWPINGLHFISVPICCDLLKYFYISPLTSQLRIVTCSTGAIRHSVLSQYNFLLLKSKYWHGIYGSGYWVRKTCQQNWVPIRNKSNFNLYISTSHAITTEMFSLNIKDILGLKRFVCEDASCNLECCTQHCFWDAKHPKEM